MTFFTSPSFARARRIVLRVLALLLLLSCFVRVGVAAVSRRRAQKAEGLSLYVLDVGQGDAILLRANGETLLVDCGPFSAESQLRVILHDLGVQKLDYFLVTHPHEDHYGNARTVLSEFTPGQVILPAETGSEEAYLLFVSELKQKGTTAVTAQTGMCFSFGGAEAEVLLSGFGQGNNGSTVLCVTYGETTVLLTGDLEKEGEAALLSSCPQKLSCDLLKVGHHGSDSSGSPEFLAAAAPRMAAISCGTGNSYGLPDVGTLSRLSALECRIYRTDLSGTLIFYSDGRTLTCRSE